MGGDHLRGGRPDHCRIPRVLSKFIEVGQVTTRAINQEADAAEKPLQVRKKGDAFEVAREEHKATAGREAVRSSVNTRDSMPGRRAIVGAVPDIWHNPLGWVVDQFFVSGRQNRSP